MNVEGEGYIVDTGKRRSNPGTYTFIPYNGLPITRPIDPRIFRLVGIVESTKEPDAEEDKKAKI